MPITVGIDSSSVSGAVGVIIDGKIAATGFTHNGLTHSQTLLPMIARAFSSAGIAAEKVDLIAVTDGPGSFTGLRIGLSTAKGIAAAFSIPCVGVSSLEAAAFGAFSSNKYSDFPIICAVMDARRDQFYNALFEQKDGALCRLCDDRAISCAELLNELSADGRKILLTGDGANLCFDKLRRSNAAAISCRVCDEEEMYIGGAAVALLGERDKARAVPFDRIMPHYLRIPQAERELNLKKSD